MLNNCANTLITGPGALSFKMLSNSELETLQDLIRKNWLRRINDVNPEAARVLEAVPMDRYHCFSQLIDHGNVWTKANRILSIEDVTIIKTFKLFSDLRDYFGTVRISNEEGLLPEEIYWRLVRPNHKFDVAPLHADKWFWDLGKFQMPTGFDRIKVWIAVFCQPGCNGFQYVPHSQKSTHHFEAVLRNGRLKPNPTELEKFEQPTIFYSEPGDGIIFHDELIHGGINGGTRTRVSIEFTLLVPQEVYGRRA